MERKRLSGLGPALVIFCALGGTVCVATAIMLLAARDRVTAVGLFGLLLMVIAAMAGYGHHGRYF